MSNFLRVCVQEEAVVQRNQLRAFCECCCRFLSHGQPAVKEQVGGGRWVPHQRPAHVFTEADKPGNFTAAKCITTNAACTRVSSVIQGI